MELHDDEPDQFELALKFIYTLNYDTSTINTMASSNKTKRILIALGIYQIADKYDIIRLYAPASDDVFAMLRCTLDKNYEILREVIRTHYETCSSADTSMGKAITSVMLEDRRDFMREKDFEAIMQSYPMFAAGMAYIYKREGIFQIRKAVCESCKTVNLLDKILNTTYYSSSYITCKGCKKERHFQ
jgi:hypothetical protein